MVVLRDLATGAKRDPVKSPVREYRTPGSARGRPGDRAFLPRFQAETGRWPSRDPIGELGGIALYGFVGNKTISSSDPHGLLIRTECPIDEYLLKYVGSFTRTHGSFIYSGGSRLAGSGLYGLILERMLHSKTTFRPALVLDKETGFETEAMGLNEHVETRAEIAWQAAVLPSVSAQAQNCAVVAKNVYAAAGVDSGSYAYREYDGIWIPGDWAYIENLNFNPDTWPGGTAGEHVIYLGDSAFYLLGSSPSIDAWFGWDLKTKVIQSADDWFSKIMFEWHSIQGPAQHGKPQWGGPLTQRPQDTRYPKTGLQ